MPTRRFVVGPEDGGQRLDRLVALSAAIGRRRARELCQAGSVLVDSRRGRPADLVPEGASVEFELPSEEAAPNPELSLDVRFETSSVVVVYKPPGQACAPLRPGETGTLANALVARYPEMHAIGERAREPGLLHRLDTQTSGLVVACRTEKAFRHLRSGLRQGKLEKRYLAIATGDLADEGSIDDALAPDPRKLGRVRTASPTGSGYARESLTRYRVLDRQGPLLLVELGMSRGFRHQIRAHLAGAGAPLVGDTLYGGRPWPEHPERHALHASYVAWAGDATLDGFAVEAELPSDMRELLGR
jgi:23S rRNA pseudouridine1911/1915/1917 synthase